MDGIDYPEPLIPYTLEEYINAWYIFQREAFMEALDSQFQEEFVAEMALLLHNPPLPSPAEELYFAGKDDFATTASASDAPPWPLTTLDGFSEFADSSPPSTGPLTPPDGMYTGPSFVPLETPQAQNFLSDIAFPQPDQNQFADLAPPAFTPYMRNNWPTEPQEYWGNSPISQFEDQCPALNGGDEIYCLGMNSNERSTTNSNPFHYEGIESQKLRSGLPAGFGHSDASGYVTENNTPHISQFQRGDVINERGPPLEKGKRKRAAEDSLEDVSDQAQASKRARVCDRREPAHRIGNQQQMSTCIVSTNVAHQRPTSNRKPRRRTPPPKEPKMTPQFYFVTGSRDSGGDAKMQTNKSLEMLDLLPVEQVDPQALMHPIEEISPARKEIIIDKKNVAVDCVLLGRRMKAKLKWEARPQAKMYSAWPLN